MNPVQKIVSERLTLEKQTQDELRLAVLAATADFLLKLAASPSYQVFLRESVEMYEELKNELQEVPAVEVWPVSGGVMVHTSASRLLEADLAKYF